jgi:hypothetical protein
MNTYAAAQGAARGVSGAGRVRARERAALVREL